MTDLCNMFIGNFTEPKTKLCKTEISVNNTCCPMNMHVPWTKQVFLSAFSHTEKETNSVFPHTQAFFDENQKKIVCELLRYVSRAVRPSVSGSYTKRTIQNREKKQKHSVSMAKPKKNTLMRTKKCWRSCFPKCFFSWFFLEVTK